MSGSDVSASWSSEIHVSLDMDASSSWFVDESDSDSWIMSDFDSQSGNGTYIDTLGLSWSGSDSGVLNGTNDTEEPPGPVPSLTVSVGAVAELQGHLKNLSAIMAFAAAVAGTFTVGRPSIVGAEVVISHITVSADGALHLSPGSKKLVDGFEKLDQKKQTDMVVAALASVPDTTAVEVLRPPAGVSVECADRMVQMEDCADTEAGWLAALPFAASTTSNHADGHGTAGQISALEHPMFLSALAVQVTNKVYQECGVDDLNFVDQIGGTCGFWESYDCADASGQMKTTFGYSKAMLADVVAACRATCGLCQLPPNSDSKGDESGSWTGFEDSVEPDGAVRRRKLAEQGGRFGVRGSAPTTYTTALNLTLIFHVVVPLPNETSDDGAALGLLAEESVGAGGIAGALAVAMTQAASSHPAGMSVLNFVATPPAVATVASLQPRANETLADANGSWVGEEPPVAARPAPAADADDGGGEPLLPAATVAAFVAITLLLGGGFLLNRRLRRRQEAKKYAVRTQKRLDWLQAGHEQWDDAGTSKSGGEQKSRHARRGAVIAEVADEESEGSEAWSDDEVAAELKEAKLLDLKRTRQRPAGRRSPGPPADSDDELELLRAFGPTDKHYGAGLRPQTREAARAASPRPPGTPEEAFEPTIADIDELKAKIGRRRKRAAESRRQLAAIERRLTATRAASKGDMLARARGQLEADSPEAERSRRSPSPSDAEKSPTGSPVASGRRRQPRAAWTMEREVLQEELASRRPASRVRLLKDRAVAGRVERGLDVPSELTSWPTPVARHYLNQRDKDAGEAQGDAGVGQQGSGGRRPGGSAVVPVGGAKRDGKARRQRTDRAYTYRGS
jgi:hypothetical protein